MTWLETLVSYLRQLIPLVVVRDGQQGVRFVLGKARGPYRPGLYFSVPLVFQMDTMANVERVVNLLSISFATKDGQAVTCAANINYRVLDARLAMIQVYGLEDCMAQEAMKSLHRCGRRADRVDLFAYQRGLETRIRRSLARKVAGWGVEVIDVGLTDLVPARQYRLMVDQPPRG